MAQNPFDQFDGATGANPFDAFDQPAPAAERPERTVLGTLGDIGVTALKGAVGLPQAFMGIADLVSGGQAGKDFEDAGLRFKDAQKILDGAYSPAQQAANREVQAAEGFVGTAKAAVENPSVIATTVGESLPQMLGGAAIARGGLALSSKVAPWAAGAIGEGVMGAGSAAEQIRSESADGLLTGKQTAAAIASGIGTAAIGGAAGKFAGSKVGQRLGLSDVDTMLATGKFNKTPAGFIKQVVGSGVSEGVFEELPQSMQEQMWQNYAQDKPILEGVGKAGALGMLAGASMGGAAGGFNAAQASITKGPDDQPAPPAPAPAPAAGDATGAAAQAPSAPGSGSKPAVPQVATADATQAETALRTPVALTALDRVNEIDSNSANIRERLSDISPENGYDPAFDLERQDMAAQAAMLEQERASITSTWPAAVKGAPTSFSTESGARLDGEYALMDAADLVTSHDEGLRPNPLFPQELQPRDRSRNASELQVSGIVQKLDPARLGLSADAATGAPIVGADGLVESGNARTIAMKRVYQANGQKAEDYKAWLRDNAAQFGLAPEAVDGMPKPVLVRVRSTPVNRAEFARQANASTVQRMSPSEQALSDGRRLASLDGLNPDEDGNFTNSHDFIRQFMATLPITEQSDLIESDGRLSTAGYRRVQNAVLARAYGDSPSLRRMTESLDNNLVNVSKALLRVAPTIAAARERMEAGTLHAADIAPDLLAAVEGLSAIKEKGWTVAQELAQTDLAGPRYTQEASDLLGFLADNVRSPRRIAEFVQRYYEALGQAGDPSQPSMFGDDSPAPARADLLKQAQGVADGARTTDDAKSAGQDAERRVHREGAQADEQGGRQPQDAASNRRSNQGDGAAPTDAGRGQQGQSEREAANDGTSEWVAFPADSGTLGIPRRDMPQIKAQHRGALMNFLEARGIGGEQAEVHADSLKPTQAEFSRVKVERFMETGPMGERSVLVSSDGYVLDGHHQWMAAKSMAVPVPVIRLGSPIRELLANVAAFPSVQQSEGAEVDPRAMVVQEFKDAMADLAQIASRYTRAAMIPEKTPDLMPTLVKLFEAAIRLVGTDTKRATAWVKTQLKQDPRFKTFWNKIGPELYQKAAMEAVNRPNRDAQAALFDDPNDAANAVRSGPSDDLAAVVAPITKTAKISGRPYDVARDNFKPPDLSSFIAPDVLARADGYVEQFHSQATPYAMPAEARAEAERMLAPLLRRAGDVKAAFDQKIIDLAAGADAMGQMLAPIKDIKRAAEKMHQDATEEGREMRASDIKDLLRSTVVVRSYPDVGRVVEAIRDQFDVVREKDKTSHAMRERQGGYADYTVFVKMPNGVLAEIQINTPEMLSAKGEQGHKLYEAARDLPSGSATRPEILAAMSEIYAAAFNAGSARPESNSRERATQAKNASSEVTAPERGPRGSMPGSEISEAPSSDALNQRPSGNLTNSSPENPKTNSQPSGNLSGTRMETPFTDIVDRTAADGEKDDASRLSFAGARAATADTHALVRAQDRLAAGEDAETVRRETGWHRGADGRMRFEISDNEAKVDMALLANLHRGGFDGRAIEHVSYRQDADGTYSLTLAPKNPQRVSDFISVSSIPSKLLPSLLPQGALDAIHQNQGEDDFIGVNLDEARRVHAPFEFMGFNALPLDVVMDHPKLFAAYPALREITVQVDRKLGNGARFAMTEYVDGSAGKVIKIGNPVAKDVDSVLLHEIQHGIQDIEGFASGGSPSQFAGVDLVSQSELDRINAKLNSGDYDMSEYDSLLQKKRDILNTAGTESSHGLYRRLAGEVEARNTQARRNITDLGRKLIAPSKTADVSDADVIVIFNGKEMHSAPAPSNGMPSRGTPAPGGMPVADLRELADRLRAAMPNMPTVNVLADPSEAPYKLREYINRQDAWDDVEGAMHNGELYLFASGLQDAARAEHVLAEHEAGHFGLRAVLGPQGLRAAMRMVWLENASVRKAATQLQKRGKLSDIAATEEVIVDLPSAQLVALKGWRKVVLKARDYLAARGYSALSQRLTDWLDGSLNQQQRADLFVADLVRAARDYVRGTRAGSPHGYLGVTRLSSSLADDLTRQEQWLNSEARARGFKDIDDLVERNYPVFEKLAALWREKNPADEGVMLSRPPQAGGQNMLPINRWQSLKSKAEALTSAENIDKFLYEFQDKLIDLKRLRDHIKALGGTINDLNDAYQGEELYHKRVAKRTEDFLVQELKPLLADLRTRGVTLGQFEQYLHARHAPEANKELSFRNPNQQMIDAGKAAADAQIKQLELALQRAQASGAAVAPIEKALDQAMRERDRWNGAQAFKGTEAERTSLSGMSDANAAAVMAGLSLRRAADMQALASQVDAINSKTLEVLQSYGLMDPQTLQAWRSTYQHYVPLHRDEAHPDSVSHPIGQGYSVKGDAGKRRAGSNAKVTHILGHIAMQREAALTRGEKNMVGQKLYMMAAQNPDPDWWQVDRPAKTRTVDAKTGLVVERVDPMYKNKPNVIMVRIAGTDAAVVFNERNERAARLAESLRNLDSGDLHYVLGWASKATRWFASVNTQYNPVFGVINFARDVQGALLNLGTTPLKGKELQVAKYMLPALRSIYQDLRAVRGGGASGQAGGQWGQLWDEMQNAGGTTGYRDLYADPKDRAKSLEKAMAELERGKIKQFAHGMLDWLADYNETMEGATRLAAYKAALDMGMSQPKAASLAKNLTVNFNRKGRQAREIGALYAFFNAAVQGTARMMETLRGPTGKKVMAGGVLLGTMNALIGLAMMGGADDNDENGWMKIPDFVRERSLVIPLGREDFVAIPLPLGFNVLPNLGRKAVEAMSGLSKKSTGAQLGEMLGMAVNAFNPFGAPSELSGAQLALMLSPTVTDPAISLLANKDWTGKPIFRENSNTADPVPGHLRAKDTASTPAKAASLWLNKMSGGTDYRPGAVSWTPDQIDFVIGQLTGGVGRELMKVNQAVVAPFTGDELPAHKIPLLGRLYGNVRGPSAESGDYHENVRELNELENELKGRARDGGDVDGLLAKEPLIGLIGRGAVAERQIQQLRKQRSLATKNEDATRVKELNDQIGVVMKDLNREVARARRVGVGGK